MRALETDLHKIEVSRERKSILNIMYDQVKSGKLPASRVIKAIINNLDKETAVDVLQDTLRFVAPTVLKTYLHDEAVEARSTDLYELVLRIMQGGRFSDN